MGAIQWRGLQCKLGDLCSSHIVHAPGMHWVLGAEKGLRCACRLIIYSDHKSGNSSESGGEFSDSGFFWNRFKKYHTAMQYL